MSLRHLCGALLLLLAPACGAGTRLPQTKLPPERTRDGEERPPPAPQYSPQPGLTALRDAALACYDLGLSYNSVFSHGGVLVIHWSADRNGDLLSLDFAQDSFHGWEINDSGATLASCITLRMEESNVRWSPSGTAPLRFSPQPAPPAAPGG